MPCLAALSVHANCCGYCAIYVVNASEALPPHRARFASALPVVIAFASKPPRGHASKLRMFLYTTASDLSISSVDAGVDWWSKVICCRCYFDTTRTWVLQVNCNLEKE